MNKRKKKTLRQYFMSNFTIIFLTVCTVIAILVFFLIRTQVDFSKQQIGNYAENVVEQYANDLKTEFEEADKLWAENNIYNSNDIVIFMTSDEISSITSIVSTLNEMMNNHVEKSKYLSSVYLYSTENDYVITTNNDDSNSGYINFFADNDFVTKSVLSAMENIVARKIGDKLYISQCMPIAIRNKVIGIMIFNYNFDVITDEFYENNSGALYITLNGDTVFASNGSDESIKVSDIVNHDKYFKQREITAFAGGKLELWYLGYMTAYQAYDRIIIFAYFVIISILLLMAAFLSVYTTKRYYNSVIDAVTELTEQSTTFSVSDNEHAKSIVGGITTILKNDTVFENVIAEKMLELRKYEAIALQSQLNSHFLFNTLNLLSILDLKQNRKATDISRVVKSMSAILKYSMDIKNLLVTVEDEISYCDKYVEIQKIKYKEKIIFEKNISPDMTERKIPKFILQPIVENAIFHGMNKNEETERIEVKIDSQNGMICITVSNTGKTIESEELKKLQEHIDKVEVNGGKHIGLANINARIKLLYGNSYGVHINSEAGKTQVCVYIPL